MLEFCLKTISLENLRGLRAQVRGKFAKCCPKTPLSGRANGPHGASNEPRVSKRPAAISLPHAARLRSGALLERLSKSRTWFKTPTGEHAKTCDTTEVNL
jgi:hypothetical protein